MILTSSSLSDTAQGALYLVVYLQSNPTLNVIGLSGDLGAGKTAFTQAVARLLGITTYVTSPTFVIQKSYEIPREDFPFKTLVHIDAYRLENANELEILDFKNLIEDPGVLILVEWSERVIEALPKSSPIIRFAFISDQVRTIEFPDMMSV